jgi:hypothetical protein
MKKRSKVALGITATLTAGAMAFALPSLAHDSQRSPSESGARGSGSASAEHRGAKALDASEIATLPLIIESIPTQVTKLGEVAKGAYFSVYRLEDDATSVPEVQPATKGRIISVRPVMDESGNLDIPEIADGQVVADLGFRAPDQPGVTKLTLYPSDGSAAILVTLTTDTAGETTAVASRDLTVAFDQSVADSFLPKNMGKAGRGKGGMTPGGEHRGGPKGQQNS